jgi:hypothetical protein
MIFDRFVTGTYLCDEITQDEETSNFTVAMKQVLQHITGAVGFCET